MTDKHEMAELRLRIKRLTHQLLVDISRRDNLVDDISKPLTKNRAKFIQKKLTDESQTAKATMQLMLRLHELEDCLKIEQELDVLRNR